MRIPIDVLERFRVYVAQKYNKYELGLLSYEVEQAINNQMLVHNITRQSTKKSMSTEGGVFKIKGQMDNIKKYLLNKHEYPILPLFVPEKHLDEAIANVRGHEIRTIRKWKRLFTEAGYIKRSGINGFEILK